MDAGSGSVRLKKRVSLKIQQSGYLNTIMRENPQLLTKHGATVAKKGKNYTSCSEVSSANSVGAVMFNMPEFF
nr:hypothetical protein [Erwinia sp. Ejp617]